MAYFNFLPMGSSFLVRQPTHSSYPKKSYIKDKSTFGNL